MLVTDNYRTEFWYHVADQKEIPIYGNVDRTIDIDKLQSIVSDLPDDNEERRDYLKGVVFSDPDTLDFLRTFVGVSDKRMYLELSYIFGKTRCEKDSSKNILDYSIYDLKKHDVPYFKRLISKGGESAKIAVGIIVDYLINKGVVTILQTIKSVSRDQLQVVVDSLISPKEVQQEETKRRGHGAEQQFAIILHQLGVAYIPADKHVNPMGTQDPNVDRYTFQIADRVEGRTWSFDVIIKDANGNVLNDGDTVTIIKDLKVKGASSALKQGTKVKNIRLLYGVTDGHDIDCKIDGFGAMKLKSSVVKKI